LLDDRYLDLRRVVDYLPNYVVEHFLDDVAFGHAHSPILDVLGVDVLGVDVPAVDAPAVDAPAVEDLPDWAPTVWTCPVTTL
jgi:hypothetical protein